MSRLEEAVVAVARFLEQRQAPYMIIGGVANAMWGIPRATLDVDLTVWISEDRLEEFMKEVTEVFPLRAQKPVDFVKENRVLLLQTREGIHIDMIFGQLPFEEEAIQRSSRETVQGMEVRVCRPEDLILHKLVSEREKDRNDVRGIIQQQRGRLDRRYLDPRVKSLAKGLDRPDIQSWYERCLREAGAK